MDTIIIKIPGPGKFQIRGADYAHFLPELTQRKYINLSETEKRSKRPYLRKFILQPPHQDRYLPRVRIFEVLSQNSNSIYYLLEIEFSVPKLLYGNSLQEANDTDKEAVLIRLKSCLFELGIQIEISILLQARVSAVHFCKNIPLPNDLKIKEILDELMKVDVSKVYDITSTKFKNNGRVLSFYSGIIEWSFYDKISDASRPKNKRIDKNFITPERAFLEKHNLQKREIFRYEYRIKKTTTVMRELNKVLKRKPKTIVVFADIFSPNICKTIVNVSWYGLIQRPENQLALLGSMNTLQLMLYILAEAKSKDQKAHSLNKALVSYGLARVIQDHGVKEVRRGISDIWNKDHSERLGEKMKVAAELTHKLPPSNSIVFISQALESYALIDLASLENGL